MNNTATGLGRKQLELLRAVADYVREVKLPPRSADLAERINTTPQSLNSRLNLLQRHGYLYRQKHRSRTLVLTDKGVAAVLADV